ncbi:hypothetical protein CB1_001514001 [Camelus ferus]|nr:hypothetical protein CB1_001514001 [Camelus ferus]
MEQAAGLPEGALILPVAVLWGHVTHLADSHISAVSNAILFKSACIQAAGLLSVCPATVQDSPWEQYRVHISVFPQSTRLEMCRYSNTKRQIQCTLKFKVCEELHCLVQQPLEMRAKHTSQIVGGFSESQTLNNLITPK